MEVQRFVCFYNLFSIPPNFVAWPSKALIQIKKKDIPVCDMKKYLICGSSGKSLTQKIKTLSGIPEAQCHLTRFQDGEIQIEIHEQIKNNEFYLIQSTQPPVNDHYMELFLLLSALKKHEAKHIKVLMPYFGYSRQDRVVAPGSPVSAHSMAQLCRILGADDMILLDIHSEQILKFFDIPVKNLSAGLLIAQQFSKHHADKFQNSPPVLVSPDAGGLGRVQKIQPIWQSPIAVIEKNRPAPGQAKALGLTGACVKNQHTVIADDMIDSAGTLCCAVDLLLQKGAKSVCVMASHGLFSGPAIDRIEKSPIQEVWITDSINLNKKASQCQKIKIVSIAQMLADTLQGENNNGTC